MGFDWTYDDAKTNGFNGNTAIYTGDFLGDRNILTLAHFNHRRRHLPGQLPDATGLSEAFVGQLGSAHMAVMTFIGSRVKRPATATRAASSMRTRSIGTATGSTSTTLTASCGSPLLTTMAAATYRDSGISGMACRRWRWIFKTSHETIWSGFGNPTKSGPLFDHNAPEEYLDGVKYGSPGGLMMIER